MTNTNNATATANKPATAKKRVNAAALANIVNKTRHEANAAERAAALANEALEKCRAKTIYRVENIDAAESSANNATAAAERAAAALANALEIECVKGIRDKSNKLEKLATAAANECGVASAAYKDTVDNIELATTPYSRRERREMTNSAILDKLNREMSTAEMWAVIADNGYTLIEKSYFTAVFGDEVGAANYKNIIAIGNTAAAVLIKYAVDNSAENRSAVYEIISKIGSIVHAANWTITAPALLRIANRVYNYRAEYGTGYIASVKGGKTVLREIIAEFTAAKTIAEAAKIAAEREAKRAAKRAAAAAKNNK